MIRFVGHALDRMQRRRISRADVEQVLGAPETTYPSHEPGRHVYVRTIGNRRIAVVVRDDDHEFVITAFDQLQQN